jgi:hypothetical protein
VGEPDFHNRPPRTQLSIEVRAGSLSVGGLLEKLDKDARERERWTSTDTEAVKKVRGDARFLRAIAARLQQRGEATIREGEYKRLCSEVHDLCWLKDMIETYEGFARQLAKGLAEMNGLIAGRRAMLRAANDSGQKITANAIRLQIAKDESLVERFEQEIESVRTTIKQLQSKGKRR